MKKWAAVLALALLLCIGFAPAAAQDTGGSWWNDRVFYEMFVRSFYDSSGDGIGDLQGAIQKLDYLNDGDPATTDDLGITGIWLMPIMASPSYHGYDVTDYRTVNPAYGSNDDFKAFVAAAHQRGIAVIVDLPVNHTSSQHPWFLASASGDPQYRDWYVWDDSCPTYRGPWNEQVWIPRSGSCYYAVFWDGMPDLNYRNPAVVDEMNSIARFWLDDLGADGFRLDGLKHIVEDGQKQINTDETHQWAAGFHDFVRSVKPEALTVGEVNDTDFVSATYVPADSDLVFDFDLAGAMLKSANTGNNSDVASLQKRVVGLYPPGQYAAFLTNHDQNRLADVLGGDVNKQKVAADLLMTQLGVPFVYYGEEIGMSGSKPDEQIRTPMQWDSTASTGGFTNGTPWEALQPNYADVNVAAQTGDAESLLTHYRDLIHLRNDHEALRAGSFAPVKSSSRAVYSFIRQSAGETLLVVANLSGKTASDYTLTMENLFSGTEASLVYGVGELAQPSGNGDYTPLAELPPYSLTVIQFTW